MNFFKKLFSSEKKESLDKGLEKSKTSFFDKLTRAIAGKSKVDDDVLDELEGILVSSDVGVDTTLKIIDRIEKRVSRDKYLGTNELNKILREEIANLLSETHFYSCQQKTLCNYGCWSKWCWKDHNYRKTCLSIKAKRIKSYPRSCRYFPSSCY